MNDGRIACQKHTVGAGGTSAILAHLAQLTQSRRHKENWKFYVRKSKVHKSRRSVFTAQYELKLVT